MHNKLHLTITLDLCTLVAYLDLNSLGKPAKKRIKQLYSVFNTHIRFFDNHKQIMFDKNDVKDMHPLK